VLQYVPVSTTTNPVTHTAEAAVKKAVSGFVKLPEALEKGQINSKAPNNINPAKPYASKRAEDKGVEDFGMIIKGTLKAFIPGRRITKFADDELLVKLLGSFIAFQSKLITWFTHFVSLFG
jgi:hypothetical protein